MVSEISLKALFEQTVGSKPFEGYYSKPKDPVARKANWEKKTNDPVQILVSTYRLEWNYPIPQLRFSFNFALNFALEWNQYVQWNLVPPELVEGKLYPEGVPVPRSLKELGIEELKPTPAKFGESRYGRSYYDPPEFTFLDLRRALWDLRYKLASKQYLAYQYTSKSAVKIVEIVKSMLKSAGVSESVIEAIIPAYLHAEGKVLTGAYVGFAIVGLSRVMKVEKVGRRTYASYYVRDLESAEGVRKAHSVTVFEAVVGVSRVGYCRVSPPHTKLASLEARSKHRLVPKELADTFKKQIEIGHKQFEPQTIGRVRYQPFTISLLRTARSDAKRFRGGYHQVISQENLNRVRRILDAEGVAGYERIAYINFAIELAYLRYKSRNKRSWKCFGERTIWSDKQSWTKFILSDTIRSD